MKSLCFLCSLWQKDDEEERGSMAFKYITFFWEKQMEKDFQP
jgi:hypothetical protein